jgi:hypothetical protein
MGKELRSLYVIALRLHDDATFTIQTIDQKEILLRLLGIPLTPQDACDHLMRRQDLWELIGDKPLRIELVGKDDSGCLLVIAHAGAVCVNDALRAPNQAA